MCTSYDAYQLAHVYNSAGTDNYKWILYGDDDTVFFTENVLQTLRGLDYRQPYFLSDCLWFPEGGKGMLQPYPWS